jgi:hypothetical protein
MRILRFTFKNEALWMILLALGLPLVGLIILFIRFLSH